MASASPPDTPTRSAASQRLGELDLHLIGEGAHHRLYEQLGAHPAFEAGVDGVHFAVWAPNARQVGVVGDFNGWDGRRGDMRRNPSVGIWSLFVPGARAGARYKFEVHDSRGQLLPLKADPFAFQCEPPPGNASIVFASDYAWRDEAWVRARPASLGFDRPISIYEVHLGSWRRKPEQGHRWLGYREIGRAHV